MFRSLKSLFNVVLTSVPPHVLSTVLSAYGNKVYIIPDYLFSEDRF